ncbi:MAG TPA: adenosine kinase [Salinivirgaceae bacterium]|nr:adenosine kinase [Salinivirgaceae bacterium]
MKVLGIGNALVDILIRLDDDSFLAKLGLPRGCMQLVTKESSDQILHQVQNLVKKHSAGGSAANTIHGLARLGIETGFVGKIGKDDLGEFFLKDLKNSLITDHLCLSSTQTGRAIALISPDGERTFATYLGAAVELVSGDLDPKVFSEYQLIHIEGYLVQNHELLMSIAKLAKANNMKISLDLASFNIVEENLTFLQDYVSEFVDILFANEEEAKSFTGKNREAALSDMAKIVETAVVKIGRDGSLVWHNGEYSKVGIIDAHPIDTTGAGDLYAAGFLYGLIEGKTSQQCGWYGAILSGHVIQNLGAKISQEQWELILQKIKG